ncbi:kelch domain-containing protein 4 [Pararge aegeria]|nr:kelch domain-containing protein 4 [Pararge aegeria]
MGKKKNKNKLSGAVKTAAKTDKKLANKLKKELANLGEEDIAKVIAEIEREEAKRAAASEKTLTGPPSSRAYATLTPHPTSNELIMFGGEFHNGQRTEVYNELLFYNPANGSWRQVKAPGAPPPRSAHQAIATSANKGELWIFGGEFTSPTETQFYHYKDLWCFSLTEKKWEKVVAPNGPSPRSGHRMVLLGRKLFTFGGYCDDGRECRYFDDLYTFCLDTRQWEKLTPSGRGPCARSACVMLPIGNDSLVIDGGFSRVREGRAERTQNHMDMFKLSCKGQAWSWRALTGAKTSLAGRAAAVNAPSNRGYVFGGICDFIENEEELTGVMSDDLSMLDLEKCRWHAVTLRSEQTAPSAQTSAATAEATATENSDAKEIEPSEEAVTVVTDEVFTMKLGGAPVHTESDTVVTVGQRQEKNGPSARMSAMLAVQRSVLYVYGGVLEKDEKQFYLGDMYSLDLHKLNEWQTLIEQQPLPDWLGSDIEEYSTSGSESETDDSEDSGEE